MHNIAGIISLDRLFTLEFLVKSLNLMRGEGYPEFGITINSCQPYKSKDRFIRASEELYFSNNQHNLHLNHQMGLAHIHRATDPTSKNTNVGPFVIGDISVVAIGHFGQYMEAKAFLEKLNYQIDSLNFAEVFATLVSLNQKRVSSFVKAVQLSYEKSLSKTNTYAVLVQDIRSKQMIALVGGHLNLYFSLDQTHETTYITSQDIPLKSEGYKYEVIEGKQKVLALFQKGKVEFLDHMQIDLENKTKLLQSI